MLVFQDFMKFISKPGRQGSYAQWCYPHSPDLIIINGIPGNLQANVLCSEHQSCTRTEHSYSLLPQPRGICGNWPPTMEGYGCQGKRGVECLEIHECQQRDLQTMQVYPQTTAWLRVNSICPIWCVTVLKAATSTFILISVSTFSSPGNKSPKKRIFCILEL